jgi:hypothetical protein
VQVSPQRVCKRGLTIQASGSLKPESRREQDITLRLKREKNSAFRPQPDAVATSWRRQIIGLEHSADAVLVAGDAGAIEILKQRDRVFTCQASQGFEAAYVEGLAALLLELGS